MSYIYRENFHSREVYKKKVHKIVKFYTYSSNTLIRFKDVIYNINVYALSQ